MVLRDMLLDYKSKMPDKYPEAAYKKFLIYWSTPTSNGKPKWRNELDKKNGAFDIPGRLATWNSNDFDNKPTTGNGKGGSLRPTFGSYFGRD